MLIVHLFFGLLFGTIAAVAGVLMGASFWSAVGCYILGANVGLLAGIPVALLQRREKALQLESV